eukprot:gene17220-23542_t
MRAPKIVIIVGALLAAFQCSSAHVAPIPGHRELPVISIPGFCNVTCSALPGTLTPECTLCLVGTGSLPDWSIEDGTPDCGPKQSAEFTWECILELKRKNVTNCSWVPPPISRLPIYESGLTSLPAMPLFNPVRHNMSDVLAVLTGSACVLEQGWIQGQSVSPVACPGSPPINTSLLNIKFPEPENLVTMHPSNRGLSSFIPEGQRQARLFYTDVDVAADSLWIVNTQVYAPMLWYKNITTSSEIERLQVMYGDKWNPEWEELAAQGDLVGFDLMWYNGMGTGPSGNPDDRWNIACHCIMQYMEDPAEYRGVPALLRVKAVLLGNANGSTDTELFTPELSESAFILAMSAVRNAYTTALIWYGHVFQLHIIQGAAMYAIYNTVEPESPVGMATHPVRQLLDPYLDPSYLLQFHASLFGGFSAPPPTPISQQDLPLFFNAFVERGVGSPLDGPTFFSTKPNQQLKWSGLDKSRFSEEGMPPWYGFRLASTLLEVFDLCKTAVKSSLDKYYPDDASVRNDKSLQAMRKAMLDPLGSNMIQITSDNKLDTRAKLFGICTQLIWQSMIHNAAKLQDWATFFLSAAHMPIAMTMNEMPDPTGDYSVEAMVRLGPDANIISNTAEFIFAFVGAPSFTHLVPGPYNYATDIGIPLYEADLPFFGNGKKAKVANKAVVKMRRDLVDFFMDEAGMIFENSTRIEITNWGRPLVMARVIAL